MTYLREARHLLKLAGAIAVAGCALFSAPAQALTVTLGTGCSGSGPYTYSTVGVDAAGNLTVNCTPSASAPGTVGFSPTVYTVNPGQSATLLVTRTGGSAGAVGVNMSVASGGCSPAAASVNFADGVSTTQSATFQAPATGSCTINMSLTGGAGATAGATQATVNVLDPNQPGSFTFQAPASGPVAGGSNYSFQISRIGGSNGTYDVAFTATPSGLTGASIVEPSPIRFATGETLKTLTLVPGSTAGTMTLTFGAATPVSPTTVPSGGTGGAITLTVAPVGNPGCPTPPTGMITLQDMPGTEGPLVIAEMGSGVVATSRLPMLPTSILGATVTMSTTGGSGNIENVEMGISPCPGDIRYGAPSSVAGGAGNQQRFGYSPCWASSPFTTNVQVNWHLTVGTHFAYCFAPQTQGPWYVSIRYTGAGRMFFQWTRK